MKKHDRKQPKSNPPKTIDFDCPDPDEISDHDLEMISGGGQFYPDDRQVDFTPSSNPSSQQK